MRPIECHVANVTGGLDPHLSIVVSGFETAARQATELLDAEGIDVVFVDAPSETIPEWGVGGYTLGQHVVLVALDPTFALREQWIIATLLHEFHHAMRERGPGCGGDLAQMLVSEGLAQLFEEEVLGEAPFYSQVPISDAEIVEARASLVAQPFSQSKWFFGADGISRSFGYAYGYRLCKEYALSVKRSAAELVATPTDDVLESMRTA